MSTRETDSAQSVQRNLNRLPNVQVSREARAGGYRESTSLSGKTYLHNDTLIKAAHSKWFERIFRLYVVWLLGRSFARINVYGDIPVISPRHPIVLAPNHSTWWDGFFVYFLNMKVFKRPFYLMMSEEQLRQFRFFTRAGAYSIPTGSPRGIIASLHYTIEVLEMEGDPASLVCIFPQGDLTSWFQRPLNFKRGLEWVLARYSGILNLVPLAIKAEFGAEQRPDVALLFGKNYVIRGTEFPGMEWLETEEIQILDKLAGMMQKNYHGMPLLKGLPSVHTRYQRFMQWFR